MSSVSAWWLQLPTWLQHTTGMTAWTWHCLCCFDLTLAVLKQQIHGFTNQRHAIHQSSIYLVHWRIFLVRTSVIYHQSSVGTATWWRIRYQTPVCLKYAEHNHKRIVTHSEIYVSGRKGSLCRGDTRCAAVTLLILSYITCEVLWQSGGYVAYFVGYYVGSIMTVCVVTSINSKCVWCLDEVYIRAGCNYMFWHLSYVPTVLQLRYEHTGVNYNGLS